MSTFLDEMPDASNALWTYQFNVTVFTHGACMNDGLANIIGLVATFDAIKSTAQSLKSDLLNEFLRNDLGGYISVANDLTSKPSDQCRIDRAVELFGSSYESLMQQVTDVLVIANNVIRLAQLVADGLSEIKAIDSWAGQRQEFLDLIANFSDLSAKLNQSAAKIESVYTSTILISLLAITERYNQFITETETDQMTALLNDIISIAEIGKSESTIMAREWDSALSTVPDMDQTFNAVKATPFISVVALTQSNGFIESGVSLASLLVDAANERDPRIETGAGIIENAADNTGDIALLKASAARLFNLADQVIF